MSYGLGLSKNNERQSLLEPTGKSYKRVFGCIKKQGEFFINTSPIEFPETSSGEMWGTIVSVFIVDEDGKIVAKKNLSDPRMVKMRTTVVFPTGNIDTRF